MKHILFITSALVLASLAACSKAETALPNPASSAAAPSTAAEADVVNAADEAVKLAQLGGGLRASSNHFSVRRCINMGNALEADYEGEWGYTIRERDFQTIAKAGFDTVRIPVRWDLKAAKKAPFAIDPAHMQRVIDVVGQAQNAGLGVVLDVHHYRDLMADAGPQGERFLAIWSQIAQAFSAAPPSVYFELLNEPVDADMAELNQLYARALQIIRRTNPTRAVMMGGNRWNSIDTLSDVRFPRDPYLVATYHDYGPHGFTHQGASWDENAPPLGQKWGSRKDITDMNDVIVQGRAFKERTGLPVFVGEFGVIAEVPVGERAAWTQARRRAMEQAGLSWCAWDFSGAFAIYDMSRERWKPQMLEALTGR